MNEEAVTELLEELTLEDINQLLNLIKDNFQVKEEIAKETIKKDILLLLNYFYILPFKYQDIFIFIIKSTVKEFEESVLKNDTLEIVNKLSLDIKRRHLKDIMDNLDDLPENIQNEFIDNIYLDVVTRFEYLTENELENNKKLK